MIPDTLRVRILSGMLVGVLAALGLALGVVDGLEESLRAGENPDAFVVAERLLFAGGVVLCLLALFLSQRTAGRIARPLRDLRRAADALAHGEHFERVEVPGDTEVAALARSFNVMAERTEGLLSDVRRTAQEAEQANEAKSAFLATVSHELRTPLHAVLGFTENMIGSATDAEQQEQLQLVQRSAEDLLGIIEDLLDYSRIEAGELRLHDVTFSLERSIGRALEPFELDARRKGLKLVVTIDEDVPDTLWGPAGRLRQVLLNLVSNAVKFTSEGVVGVAVSVANESSTDVMLKFMVKDTGIGIPGNRILLLFRPFSQVENANDRRYGGTGLGLAITKELVELMGGICSVQSELGVGSTFTFTARFEKHLDQSVVAEDSEASIRELLSARMQSIPPALPSAPVPVPQQSASPAEPRVLVVEDNPLNQRMAELVLRKGGLRCDVASDGLQALAMHAESGYDLILMDCQMPEMDGLEATRRIRHQEDEGGRHVAIVALTANAFEQDRDACMRAGMDDFLSKPFKADALLEKLERWLPAESRKARS